MPGYSAVIQTVPNDGNFGETPMGSDRLGECLFNRSMTLDDFLVINNINDHMIDIYTTSLQVAKYTRVNLLEPIRLMSIIDEPELSERPSFIDSDSDRSMFSRSLSKDDSIMDSMSLSDIFFESMMPNSQFLDEEEEKKLDDVSFHLT